MMRVGIFSDTHDHLENIRRLVMMFNERECACVLFAGDLVSTFAVPPLRELRCPLYGCFGDNEGNRIGIRGGFRILGEINEGPAGYLLADGTRVVIAHMERQLKSYREDFDIAVYGHTHRPAVSRDERGRLFINPGEASGWTYGHPTVALLETTTRQVDILPIDQYVPLPSWDEARRARAARRDSSHPVSGDPQQSGS